MLSSELKMQSDIVNTTTLGLLSVFLPICLYLLWFYKQSFNYWKSRGLEYLEPSIPFGNAINLYTRQCSFGELFSHFYLQLKEKGLKHGGAYFFWKPVYIPVDPEIVKHILISDFENFPNHGLYIDEHNDPLSGHIFNMENNKWRSLRAKLPSAFTSAKMRKMFLVMKNMTEQFKKNLDGYAESDSPVEIKSELSKFTTDIISACALGIESNTMKNENKEMLQELRTFFDHQWNVYRNTMVVMVPRHVLQKFKFRIITKGLEKYFMNLCKNIMSYRKQEKTSRGDITDILIRLTESNEEHDFAGKGKMKPLNFGEFTAQMLVFTAAGYETSSSTQTFAMYELAKNPECLKKLRNEIKSTLEKYNNEITYDSIMEMKYLDEVIEETLRLYPVFPVLSRVCLNDYKVPGTDVTLERNTLVLVTNMGIQRDPEYYPNPDQFDPDRFSNENKSKRPHIVNLPFGEGPRVCIGKRFGLLQSKVGLITMVTNYDFSLNEKTSPSFKFVPNELILRKTGNVWLNLKKLPA